MKLLKCQKEASEEFVRMGGRGYLDSNVGSGKTYLAAECFRLSMEKYPAPGLYLVTATGMKNQLEKFLEFGIKAVAVDMSADKRFELWKTAEAGTVYIASTDSVSCPIKEWARMRRVPWGMIAIDEGDKLTAGASQRNKRLISMFHVRHKLMMTGTPLKNGLVDSFLPLMFLSKELPWRNWTDYRTNELLYENPKFDQMLTGYRNEEKLEDMMAEITFTMVNPDAPKELVAQEVIVEMGREQREAYEKMNKELILEIEKGTLTISNHAVLNLRCRQFAALPEALDHPAPSAKEDFLVKRMLPKLSGKTIIFTSFASIAVILGERYGWQVIHGKMSMKKRNEIVDSEPDILIATSAAERCLDMPWLSNVICMDRGFTEAVMRQRAGRATRYGHDNQARLFLMSSPDTVDMTSEYKIVMRKIKEAKKVAEKAKERAIKEKSQPR